MTESAFKSERLNSWVPPTEAEVYLDQLAWEYHEDCEIFDRVVCSRRINGVAIPINGLELTRINDHSRLKMNEILDREFPGDPEARQELRKAISRVANRFEEYCANPEASRNMGTDKTPHTKFCNIVEKNHMLHFWRFNLQHYPEVILQSYSLHIPPRPIGGIDTIVGEWQPVMWSQTAKSISLAVTYNTDYRKYRTEISHQNKLVFREDTPNFDVMVKTLFPLLEICNDYAGTPDLELLIRDQRRQLWNEFLMGGGNCTACSRQYPPADDEILDGVGTALCYEMPNGMTLFVVWDSIRQVYDIQTSLDSLDLEVWTSKNLKTFEQLWKRALHWVKCYEKRFN